MSLVTEGNISDIAMVSLPVLGKGTEFTIQLLHKTGLMRFMAKSNEDMASWDKEMRSRIPFERITVAAPTDMQSSSSKRIRLAKKNPELIIADVLKLVLGDGPKLQAVGRS